MKKIYSLVLMAMMLLVGTNAWAAHNAAWLQAQFDAVTPGSPTATITLDDDVTLADPVWLGTESLTGAKKSIVLDLNGHNITMAANKKAAYYMFVITRGELLVRNSGANVSNISLTGTTSDGSWENGHFNESSQIFSVYGSYKSSRWEADGSALSADSINTCDEGYFSHLEIGERVNIIGGQDVLASAIVIDQLNHGDSPARKGATAAGKTIGYYTDIHASNYGYAYGVRIDVKGNITMAGHDGSYIKYEKVNGVANTPVTYGYKCYGIKTNGNLASPLNGKAIRNDNTLVDNYLTNYNVENHKKDTTDVPFVYVHRSATITTTAGSARSCAIYSSGYAKYLIEGTCEGNVGVNIKSGKVILHDATIASTATTYSQATGQGGASGSGSAVVLNSTSYEGGMQVTISGDTKITADAGYGIEEVVNTQTEKVLPNPEYDPTQPTSETNPETVTVKETKVTDIIFEGGTIEGGDKGAVVVSLDTEAADKDANEETTITVYGANVSGDVQVGKTGDITDILPTDNNDNPTAHVTVVTDPTTGNQTLVISEGAPVPAAEKDKATVAGNTGTVNWKHLDTSTDPMAETLVNNLTLDELEINQSYAQILTVKTGTKLEVGRVILGAKAQIIVEAGAKFVVTGKQGIIAPVVSNILLKHEGALLAADRKYATFLFNDSVTSNRHPNATVELTTYSYSNGASDYQWERFGVPTHIAVDSIKSASGVATAFSVATVDGWQSLGYINYPGHTEINPADFDKPFATYELIANRSYNPAAPTIGPKYQFYGELVGNDNAVLNVNKYWTGFTNSYSAEIDVPAFFAAVKAASIVDEYIYIAKPGGMGSYNWDAIDEDAVAGEKLAPMQAFILAKTYGSTQTEEIALNYKSMVYAPGTAKQAPRRRVASDEYSALVRVIVENEFGVWDNVKLRETATRTKEVEKYMNSDVNIYAMSEKKNAIFAVENLENTYLGFSTVKGGNFTISFAGVEGVEYTMIDHETGARVAMVEGNAYEFTAAANTVNDYRFEIVESAKLPTAIDNTEAVKSAKGIYTITGQYLGEMNVWNTLPAGVYVINGEKRVK